MIWLVLSLLTALAVSGRDLAIKYFEELTPLDIAALELFWSLPFLALGFLLVPAPELDGVFWKIFVLSLPLNLSAYFLYLYAIKISPLSLTVPFLSFTPLFMVLTGFITLGETVNGWGGLGILCIAAGSYVLNFPLARKGFFKPFAAIFQEKGSWIMLLVAFLFSFAAVIGKKAMIHSSPLYFAYSFALVFNLIILTGIFLSGNMPWRLLKTQSRRGFMLGSLMMAEITGHSLAIAISTAVYMVAVKRSSILFSVFLSWLILKEGDYRSCRGLGTLLMFGGTLLITVLG